MDNKINDYRIERDTIVEEIGSFDEEDFIKSGISLDEYTNPDAEVIRRLVEYISREYNQTSVYNDIDN